MNICENTLQIGTVSITPILDGAVNTPVNFLYASGANTESFEALLSENGMFEMAIGGYLVKDGEHILLVDAGQGLPAPMNSPAYGHLLENMEKLNISVENVTDVVFTHLHVDHIGWASNEGKPVFPNAVYWVPEKDYEYFQKPGADTAVGPGMLTAPERLAPVFDSIRLFQGNVEFSDHIRFIEAPGHTPGEIVIEILSDTKKERAVLLGDVVHHPAELVDSSWVFVAPGSDADQKQAAETRKEWIGNICCGDTLVTAAHFPKLAFGRVKVQEDGKRTWETVLEVSVPSVFSI